MTLGLSRLRLCCRLEPDYEGDRGDDQQEEEQDDGDDGRGAHSGDGSDSVAIDHATGRPARRRRKAGVPGSRSLLPIGEAAWADLPPATGAVPPAAMSEVLFLTRDGCHLCHRALPWVEESVARRGHHLSIGDVDADPALGDRFGDRVPVVLRDGVEVLWGRFGRRDVRRALR